MYRFVPFLPALFLLAACGGGVSGEYGNEKDGQWKTQFVFKGKTVEVSNPFGEGATLGTFEEREDGRISMTVNGETNLFKLRDDGCIEIGMFWGVVCPKP